MKAMDDWFPFQSRTEFEFAELVYCKEKMSKANTNLFLELIAKWPEAASLFDSHDDMCGKIDATELGDAPWQKATLQYREDVPARDVPEWMTASYDLYYRDPHIVVKNILSNTTFKGGIDCVPYQEFGHKDERRYENLMSGDWAYRNAVRSLFFVFWSRRTDVTLSPIAESACNGSR
jgi:Plavaka transposase